MPISFRQAGSLFVAGPNISIFPSGNTYAISGSASGSVGSGVTGITSAGTGNILLLSGTVVNNNLVQKSLSAGTGIAIIDNGTGTLTFSSTSTSTGTIISGTNAGTGVAIFSGAVGSNLVFRRIISGSNIGVYTSGNDIVISGTSGTINSITGVSNIGGGASQVLSSVTGNILVARTLSGTGGIVAYEFGSLIIVRPTGLTASRLVISDATGGLVTSDNYQVDSTNGTIAIGGVAAVSSTRLLLAAGSSSISQIRMNSFAAGYAGATAGDIWYNSTSGNSLFFNKSTSTPTPFIFKDNNYSLTGTNNNRILQTDVSGTIVAINYPTQLGIFNSITSTTISGISELSVLNTGSTFLIGTNIINSSVHGTTPQLVTGKKFRFNAKGNINSDSSAGNLASKLKLGSVIIASATTVLQNNINGSFFEIDCTFTIRTQGASGKAIGSGKMLTDAAFLASATSPIVSITSLGEVTIDTTTDKIFDLTLQFDNSGNNIVINEATLEYLN